MKKFVIAAWVATLGYLPGVGTAQEQSFPDILVLGDSQISFSAGPPYIDFFENIDERCEITPERAKLLPKLGDRQTAALGVRSTSLHSWTARNGRAKDTICEVDKKWGVNAGVFGVNGDPKRAYVQIGKGRDYQFCKPNQSAFEAGLTEDYYDPSLIVLAFLGNAAERWANDSEKAASDVARTIEQLPPDMGCVFLATAPVFSKKTNDLRARAQSGIKAAFEASNGRCEFVEGFTPEVRSVIEGKAKFFRRHEDGRVKDPLHPSRAAIRAFLDLNTPQLCNAVFDALK